tara:strand:+ start:22 stop:438 length:417 start_codon:yes stop_codon:yes gene_type:complete
MERICFPRLSLSFPLLLLGALTLPLLLDDRGEAGLDHLQAVSESHPDGQGPSETGIPGRQEDRDENSVPTELSGLDTGRAFSPQCSERIETEFSRAAEIPGSSTPAGESALHRPTDLRLAPPASQSWKHQPVRGPPAA